MSNTSGKYQNQKSGMTPAKWAMIALAVVAVIVIVVLLVKENQTSDEAKATAPSENTNFSVSVFVPTTENAELPTEQVTASSESKTEETSAPQTEQTEPKEIQSKETQPKETQTKETQPKDTQPAETEPEETTPVTKPVETEPKETEPSETEPKPTEKTEFTPATEPEAKPITLPYEIPATTLKIHRIAPYDGIYLEDGANQEASEIAMILLENTGAEAVEYADITLKYGDATISFKASALPAGAKVIVQAVDRAEIPSGKLTECYATVATLPSLTMSEDQASVTDNGNNTLTVKNLTGRDIPMVRVFYKYYMEDDAVYVGGITYTAKITNLSAGESLTINPSHYASEGGKIVMIRTYDTVE